MAAMPDDRYTSGEYQSANQGWHDEDAPVKAREIAAFLQKNQLGFATCADIGCGTGGVIRILAASHGAAFFGYDITAVPQAAARDMPDNVKIVVGDFFEVTERATYDLILLNDVLEHVPDFFAFLTRLKSYARHLLIRLPIEINVVHALTNRQIYNWHRAGHLHFFSKDTGLAAIAACGLEVVDWQYVFDGLNMPHTSRSLVKLALKAPRRLSYRLFPDLGVRIFGGAGILVLARNPAFAERAA